MSMYNGALVGEIVKHRAVRWKDPLNGHKTHTELDCVERKLLFPVWKKQTSELGESDGDLHGRNSPI